MIKKLYSLTPDEKILDKVIEILSQTVPENTAQAMTNYAKILRLLDQISDKRVGVCVTAVKNVYIYPERKLHNSMARSVHDFRETLLEEKLQQRQQLGESTTGLTWKHALPVIVLGWLLIR